MTSRWIWTIILLVVAGISGGAQERRETIPMDVQHAEQKLTKWLRGFVGKTEEKIRKSLGDPDNESSWDFEKKQEPVWKYKVLDSTELTLFSTKDRSSNRGYICSRRAANQLLELESITSSAPPGRASRSRYSAFLATSDCRPLQQRVRWPIGVR